MITAAAFVKGLLKISDDITPIMFSFVNSNQKAIDLLDYSKKDEDQKCQIDKSQPVVVKAFHTNKPIS